MGPPGVEIQAIFSVLPKKKDHPGGLIKNILKW